MRFSINLLAIIVLLFGCKSENRNHEKEEIVEIVLKLFELFAIFIDVMGLD